MYRTGFTQKVRAKTLEYPIGLLQDPPEAMNIFPVVRGMLVVLRKRNRIANFNGGRIDVGFDVQRPKKIHIFGVECCHRLWPKGHGLALAPAYANLELMVHEIEFHV